MKCLFDRPIKAHDVVLLPLYKRVFPKMTYDSHVTGRLLSGETVHRIMDATPSGLLPPQTILKSRLEIDRAMNGATGHEMEFAMLTPDEEALFH